MFSDNPHLLFADNISDLGAICHHEIANWHQLVELETDNQLRDGLGGSIPADAYPSTRYQGSAFVKVIPALSQAYPGQPLTLRVLVMGSSTSAILRYRPLGDRSYTEIPLTHVARSVYTVTIPAQRDDFEYYIEAQTPIGNATYPVSAPPINQTVVVLGAASPPAQNPPTPNSKQITVAAPK